MIWCTKVNNSGERKHCTENHAAMSSIPGFSKTSKEKKPSDQNLSPFQICELTQIQYGDTSIASTSTENPAWSPGECLNIEIYEGRLRKKQYTISSQVILSNLNNLVSIIYFRTLFEQEKQRQESF